MSVLKKYGFWGSLNLGRSYLFTKIFYPQAKIIRLPFDIRNKRFIHIGKNFITGTGCRIEAYPKDSAQKKILYIGDNVQINDYVHIACSESVTIKNDVLIAGKVFITDLNHGNYSLPQIPQDHPGSTPSERKLITQPVFIDEKVWVGESVMILPGAKIGKGSIIGAMSLVNSEIPPFSIAVGCPARVIKKYDFEKKMWLLVDQ